MVRREGIGEFLLLAWFSWQGDTESFILEVSGTRALPAVEKALFVVGVSVVIVFVISLSPCTVHTHAAFLQTQF